MDLSHTQAHAIQEKFTNLEDKACAVLLLLHASGALPCKFYELKRLLETAGLSRQVNSTRLRNALSKKAGLRLVRKDDTFDLFPAHLPSLLDKYSISGEHRKPTPSFGILPRESIPNSRQSLVALRDQINTSYKFELFDCTACTMRRLMECLLIEAFINNGDEGLIRSQTNDLKMLKGIISQISNASFRLSRNSPDSISDIKELGDTAAHHRYHITTKQDIDEVKAKYRRLISELVVLSGL